MPRANHPTIRTYAQAAQFLGGKDRRNLPSIRYSHIERQSEDSIALVYHWTPVITYHANGHYTLRHGGYTTVTTKSRINEFTPFQIYQKNFAWYLNGESFIDGITLTSEGKVPTLPKTVAEFLAQSRIDAVLTLSQIGACFPAQEWLASLPADITPTQIVDAVPDSGWLHWLSYAMQENGIASKDSHAVYAGAFSEQYRHGIESIFAARHAFKVAYLDGNTQESANA